MNDKYILDEKGNTIPEPDLLKWASWFEENRDKKRVKADNIGKARISTVFLGIDHSFGEGKPILWETMIFGGEHDDYQKRYTSREEALEGHQKALDLVKETPEWGEEGKTNQQKLKWSQWINGGSELIKGEGYSTIEEGKTFPSDCPRCESENISCSFNIGSDCFCRNCGANFS